MDIPKQIEQSIESAGKAGLHYVTDISPGIIRKKIGKSFTYIDTSGSKISDDKTLSRIKSLAIPPAWKEVWICTKANGHLQATGKDAKGRKQYRYHPKWREVRDGNKYNRMVAFGYALPKIRRRVAKDLKLDKMPKEKILATIVSLLDKTLIRVGNEEYAKENHSYGLTTMRDKHVTVKNDKIKFAFIGKSGVKHEISIQDKKLAKIIKKSQELPGYELFQYIDDNGDRCSISSSDVNNYLKKISGEDFTAKDFRTWHGTLLAAETLSLMNDFTSITEAKKQVIEAVEVVSAQLGNTKAVCRKCYIHPSIIEHYLQGNLKEELEKVKSIQVEESIAMLHKGEIEIIKYLKQVTVHN